MIWIATTILILSAALDAADQLIRLKRTERSWLPPAFFEWDLRHIIPGWLFPANAWHSYQGSGIWGIGISVAFSLTLFSVWWAVPLTVIAWYLVRNVWMHVGLLKFEYWSIPILKSV